MTSENLFCIFLHKYCICMPRIQNISFNILDQSIQQGDMTEKDRQKQEKLKNCHFES